MKRTLPITIFTLLVLYISAIDAECCYTCIETATCKDCTLGTLFCAYGKCNVFGCACSGGCREQPYSDFGECKRCNNYNRDDFSTEEYPTKMNYGLHSWMKEFPNDVLISELTIPGTHDTMAHYGGPWARCQSMHLKYQLDAGIRALDIRCKHVNNAFKIYHGGFDQHADFDDVLTNCIDFLRDHPSETIIMRVKEEGNPSHSTRYFVTTLKEYLDLETHKPFIWNGNSIPTLSEVRGKLVILKDFPEKHLLNLGLNWEEMRIQDDYQIPTMWDIPKKFDKISNFLDVSKSGSKNLMYVNFMSASQGGTPADIAKAINGMVLRKFQKGWTGCGGIMYTDFPGWRLIQAILELNEQFPSLVKLSDSSNGNHLQAQNYSSSTLIVQQIMEEADKDGNHMLDFSECYEFISGYQPQLSKVQMMRDLLLLDANGNGYIEMEEIDNSNQ